MELELLQQDPVDNEMSTEDVTPDEAAASLAFATQLSEGMMAPEDMPIDEPKEGEGMEIEGEMEEDSDIDLEDEIQSRVKEEVEKEMSAFRKELKEMLDDDDE